MVKIPTGFVENSCDNNPMVKKNTPGFGENSCDNNPMGKNPPGFGENSCDNNPMVKNLQDLWRTAVTTIRW